MERYPILFVDDDKVILTLVEQYLTRQGFDVTVADSGAKALKLVQERRFDIVFTDFKMPQLSGLELLTAIKTHQPDTEVIIVTGYGTLETAVQAMKHGSYDYLQKPFKLDHLKLLIERIIEEKKLKIDYLSRKRRTRERHRFDALVGASLQMQEIYEAVERAAPGDRPVLLRGESGTGKRLTARIVHRNSHRRDAAFVPIHCAGIAGEFAESKLVNHLAEQFEAARGGTVFLDEIADLSPAFQARLIQVLTDGAVGREDTAEKVPVDVRIVSGTAQEPTELLERGVLRKDLMSRLGEVTLVLPPLRERKEDLCLLIHHFVYRAARKAGRPPVFPDPGALDRLMEYHWPGNLNQLETVIERAYTLGADGAIREEHLPAGIRAPGRP